MKGHDISVQIPPTIIPESISVEEEAYSDKITNKDITKQLIESWRKSNEKLLESLYAFVR